MKIKPIENRYEGLLAAFCLMILTGMIALIALSIYLTITSLTLNQLLTTGLTLLVLATPLAIGYLYGKSKESPTRKPKC
jgi:chromate transport protein ChrA